MSKAIEILQAAQKRAMAGRPKVGGFPYLAETLRRAGVTRNVWNLPSCQSFYLLNEGPVCRPGRGARVGIVDVHFAVGPRSAHPRVASRPGRREHVSGNPDGNGTEGWSVTMSISGRARSPTTGTTQRNTSKGIRGGNVERQAEIEGDPVRQVHRNPTVS